MHGLEEIIELQDLLADLPRFEQQLVAFATVKLQGG